MATTRDAGWLIKAALLALVALAAGIRIQAALASPAFDTVHPEGLLRSDPGLLYYLTESVALADGGIPDDWRADPRIQHPERVDVPATYTVGQEFLVAWVRRLVPAEVPLHVLCTWVMGIVASLSVLGVFGLARELSRSPKVGLLAGLLFVLLPIGYRTAGFVLMREDLSLPLFAGHLYLLARAARVRSAGAFALAGLALGAALATWHAMTFVAALEAACFLAWLLWRGESPFAERRALLVPGVVAAIALAVPVLRAHHALLSLPLQLAAALAVPALIGWTHPFARRALAALGTWALLLGASALLGGGDLSHVWEVMGAKLAHLGRLPDDPALLSFEARMLWQGPFESPGLGYLISRLHVGLLLAAAFVLLALRDAARGTLERGAGLLALGLAATLVAGGLVGRMLVVFGLLVPVAGALVLARATAALVPQRRRLARALIGATLAAHLLGFASWRQGFDLPWHQPRVRQLEIRALADAVRRHVPPGEAIAADFLTSAALLASTRHPIVLEPKWETAASRARVRDFWQAFFSGTPDDLRRLLVERYRCRWLVVERSALYGPTARYLAGMRRDQFVPRVGSPAWYLLSSDEGTLRSVPGYHLVWRSPPELRLDDGSPSDFVRLYRLEAPGGR